MKARTLLVLLVLVATSLVLWRSRQDPERTEIGVTGDLAGRWVTNDTRYAGRYLEIGPGEVIFGQGDGQEEWHQLTGVSLEPAASGPPTYVLRYQGDSAEESGVELRAVVEDGALRLDHPPEVVWRRAP